MKQNQLFKRGVNRTKKVLLSKSKKSYKASDDVHRVARRHPSLYKVNKVPAFMNQNMLGMYHE